MTTTTLAYFPSPAQGVWHLGAVPIRAYAVCIIVGIIAALLIGDRRWAARGGERGVIYDIALWAVPFGLIGGRLYHVMTDWKTYFGPGGAGPVAALRIMDGGLGIWGAVALGGVGAWIACRRRGIPLPAFGDAIAPGIVLAQAIGRVGNYFNQELYGRETTVPWGMKVFYRQDPSGIIDVHSLNGVSTGQVAAIVHPTFLYELLWNLLVFVILIVVDRRRKIGHGRLFALYVALYCLGRFAVELLRDDTATHIAGIRINSFTSTFVFLGAVVYLILAKKGREDPSTLVGHRRAAEQSDDEPELSPELAKEFSAVAAGTGVVAAATVAGLEDEEDQHSGEAGEFVEGEVEDFDDESESADDLVAVDGAGEDDESELDLLDSADESESVDEFEPLDDSVDEVDETGESEVSEDLAADEAVVEAEVAAPGVAVESADDAEEDLIDEYHDPIGEDELEGLTGDAEVDVPLSEQEEALRAPDTGESEDEESEDEESDDEQSDDEESDDAAMVIDYSSDEVPDTAATIVYPPEDVEDGGDDAAVDTDMEPAAPEAVETAAVEAPAEAVSEPGEEEAEAEVAEPGSGEPAETAPKSPRRGLFRRRR